MLRERGFKIAREAGRFSVRRDLSELDACSWTTLGVGFDKFPELQLLNMVTIPCVNLGDYRGEGIVAEEVNCNKVVPAPEIVIDVLTAKYSLMPSINSKGDLSLVVSIPTDEFCKAVDTPSDTRIVFPQFGTEPVERLTRLAVMGINDVDIIPAHGNEVLIILCLKELLKHEEPCLPDIIWAFGNQFEIADGMRSYSDLLCCKCKRRQDCCQCFSFVSAFGTHYIMECEYGHRTCVFQETCCSFGTLKETCGSIGDVVGVCDCVNFVDHESPRNYTHWRKYRSWNTLPVSGLRPSDYGRGIGNGMVKFGNEPPDLGPVGVELDEPVWRNNNQWRRYPIDGAPLACVKVRPEHVVGAGSCPRMKRLRAFKRGKVDAFDPPWKMRGYLGNVLDMTGSWAMDDDLTQWGSRWCAPMEDFDD
jgi:hypothetical protein